MAFSMLSVEYMPATNLRLPPGKKGISRTTWLEPEAACASPLRPSPESIGAARQAVSDLAQQLGVEEPALGDLKTVVSEGCSNVVRHAYPDSEGSFELAALPEGDNLTIVVRDSGVGMRPLVQAESSSLRLASA